ncbi:MAG: MFS transporter [Betaproteobacteria bacterium]|nr:MFS transporter [Betaproteobacteria bacterium]
MQSSSLLSPYRAFLKIPDVPAMILMGWLSRSPIAMNALGMLLFLRNELGNFQAAGQAVGAFFVSMAVAAPVVGRVIDRHGPRWPLIVDGVMHPLFMAAILWAGTQHASQSVLLLLAVGAGLFAPPVTILTRTTWRHRFDDEHNRKMAYSIDSVMIELNFTFGPLFVAALIPLIGPVHTFACVIGVGIAAVLTFVASPILKYWKTEPAGERHLLGPLTSGKLVGLFGLSFGLTLSFGLLEVGYPAYATFIDWVAFGGVLLALNALGSGVGGFVYGAIHSARPLEQQFTLALAIMGIPLFLHWPFDAHVAFALLAFVSGLMIAPALTAQTLLVTRIAPPKYATEAFTWSSTFIVSGLGLGMALGGALTEQLHPKAPFVAGGALVAGMAVLSLLLPRAAPRSSAPT